MIKLREALRPTTNMSSLPSLVPFVEDAKDGKVGGDKKPAGPYLCQVLNPPRMKANGVHLIYASDGIYGVTMYVPPTHGHTVKAAQRSLARIMFRRHVLRNSTIALIVTSSSTCHMTTRDSWRRSGILLTSI